MKKFLDREAVALASTFFGFTLIVPLLILFRSKDEYVRFWAAQSLSFFIVIFLADWFVLLIRVFNFLPSLIFIVTILVWLIMVYKSWLGYTWEIPFLGKLSRKLSLRVKK